MQKPKQKKYINSSFTLGYAAFTQRKNKNYKLKNLTIFTSQKLNISGCYNTRKKMRKKINQKLEKNLNKPKL